MNLYNRIIVKITFVLNSMRRLLVNLFWPNVVIGKQTIIEPHVIMRSQYGGNIVVGSDCYISAGAQLLTHGGNIEIGNNCTINPYSIVYGQGGVKIGNYVRIASHCTIVPANHIFDNPDELIYLQGLSKKGIVIEDDVWLGTGVKVLDGVTIKKGCVKGQMQLLRTALKNMGFMLGFQQKK